MYSNMQEIVANIPSFENLKKNKNVYERKTVDFDFAEKVSYRLDGSRDWFLYVDGKTFRKLSRGIAFCTGGISFCDDSGEIQKIMLIDTDKLTVSNTSKALIINGHIITLDAISLDVAKILIGIKSLQIKAQSKSSPVKMAELSNNKNTGWYFCCESQIDGPFDDEEAREYLSEFKGDLLGLQVWSGKFDDWKFVIDTGEFKSFYKGAKYKSTKVDSANSQNELVDVNHCRREELLFISCISREKLDAFLSKRDKGYVLRDIFDFQEEFDVPPHMIDQLRDRLLFRGNSSKSVRRVDL